MRESIERFLSALEAGSDFSSNTVSAYRNDLNQFVVYLLGSHDLRTWVELQDTHLTSYVLHMREREYASSTIARKTAALKSFSGYLRRREVVGQEVGTKLSSPKVAKYMPRAISREEVAHLLRQPTEATPDRPHSQVAQQIGTTLRLQGG